MPVIESRCVVPVDVSVAFAVSQTTGETRKRWDPFIRRQYFVDGATAPAKGVRTYTVQRFGFRMESEYVSYNPPSNVGMKMTKGSWFFERLAGGWKFTPVADDPGSTLAVWRYNFACRPAGWHRSPNGSAPSSCSTTWIGASAASRKDAPTRSCSPPCAEQG